MKVGSVRVEFAALVTRVQTNTGVVDETDDLDVAGGSGPLI